jgi:hypothetical protein
MFWQGGFVFYAGVVVPVGMATIGFDQSRVTRHVTVLLNLSGAIALLPLAWDVWATSSHRVWRWSALLILALTLPVLIWLHGRLVEIIDPEKAGDYSEFYPTHRWYLWISTLQWAFALLFLVLSLRAWKEVDGRATAAAESA